MRIPTSRLLLLVVSLALPALALGAVYKSVDPDGKITYSDQPQSGATTVDLPKFPTPAPLPGPVTTSTTAPAASGPQGGAVKSQLVFPGYSKFSIVAPENDATVGENTGSVEVTLTTEPAWDPQWGHSIKVILDGKPLPEAHTPPKFQLNNADRGSHTLQTIVVDAQQAELVSSPTVTFHLKRQSALLLKESPLRAPNFNPPAAPSSSAP